MVVSIQMGEITVSSAGAAYPEYKLMEADKELVIVDAGGSRLLLTEQKASDLLDALTAYLDVVTSARTTDKNGGQ